MVSQSQMSTAPSGPPAPPSPRPTARWALTVHIAGSVSALGADLVLLALGLRGVFGADPVTVYPAMAALAAWVLAPLAVVAAVSGILIALAGRWGLLRRGWVTTKLVITVSLAVLVIAVAAPGLTTAAGAAIQGLPVATGARTAYALVPAVTALLLGLNVALGVYKPRRRRRLPPP
ncbi:hypothetical protein [Agromyces bauzanensis]